jgi:glutamate transport system permease protein
VDDLISSLPSFGAGLLTTLELAVLSFPLAVVIGTVLGVCRVGPLPPLRRAAAFYVHCLRNAPLLLVMVMVVFGLPQAGLKLPLFVCLVVGSGFYFAAYVCETVRSGIQGVPAGQIEAARAIGMSFRQVLGSVVLPQAFRSMVQPLGTIFIGITLSSALGAALGVQELTGAVRQYNLSYAQPVTSFVIASIGYLAITLGAGYVIGRVEKSMRIVR